MNIDDLLASPEGKTLEFKRAFRLPVMPRKSRVFFLVNYWV
ncbi:MAG: hypothetical protein Q9M30_10465 [Mariprofundaceae bacterium]|nr:hypothetical protein [Mariprofundaceae bacterium]